MGRAPRYVDPTHPRGPVARAYARFSATRAGRFISSKFVWKVDPHLLRASGGRLGLGGLIPTLLLETRGAKTGAVRRNGVIYFHDAERITIVASLAGAAKNPSWFHNLVSNPGVRVNGLPMRAAVVADEAERQRLWVLADNVFAPYADYRRQAGEAGRTIPIVQLTPE